MFVTFLYIYIFIRKTIDYTKVDFEFEITVVRTVNLL